MHGASARHGTDAVVAATLVIGGVGQLLTDWLDGHLELDRADVVDAARRLWDAMLVERFA